MKNIEKVGILSGATLIVQLLLTKFVYPVLGRSTQTIFSIGDGISPVTGVGGLQLGDRILGYLTGYLPFDISSFSVWIAMLIGVFALVYAGMFVYEQRWAWKGKNETQRLFAILIYGHIILYLILLALKGSVPGIAVNLLIGLGINLLLVATAVSYAAKKITFIRI